jgi:GNAT superfamily N-acetyltransferase
MVAVDDNRVIGSASNCQITLATWNSHISWDETVGGFSFEGHDPNGEMLFGADISVHPEARGRGVGRALYVARFELVRQQGLSLFGTACRMPDFASAGFGTPQEFAESVVRGERSDRTLTPLLRVGLSFTGVIENHMDDVESGHAAAILEWRP